jgi:hypothetical protein
LSDNHRADRARHVPQQQGPVGRRPRMGAAENLREAIRLTWRAAPKLLIVTVAVPAAIALVAAAQLLLVREFTAALLGEAAAGDPGDTVRQLMLPAALIVGSLAIMMVLTDVQRLLQELLTERVRLASARRMHQAIGQLDLVDYDVPEIHDRIHRASTSDFRPAQVVRDRTYERLLAGAEGLDASRAEALARYVERDGVDLKADDARLLLRGLADAGERPSPTRVENDGRLRDAGTTRATARARR